MKAEEGTNKINDDAVNKNQKNRKRKREFE